MLQKKPSHSCNYRSSSYTLLVLNRPAHSKAALDDSLFYLASFWNSIPNDVRCAPSLSSFLSRLKTYLFCSVFKDCTFHMHVHGFAMLLFFTSSFILELCIVLYENNILISAFFSAYFNVFVYNTFFPLVFVLLLFMQCVLFQCFVFALLTPFVYFNHCFALCTVLFNQLFFDFMLRQIALPNNHYYVDLRAI